MHSVARFLLGLIAASQLGTAVAATGAFPDVPDIHPQGEAIQYVLSEKIIMGYPNGNFGPNNPLNRAELMKVLVESAYGAPDDAYAQNCFPDVRASDWFASYVCYATEHKWVSGYPDGLFRPSQSVTMVEAIKMLVASRSYPLDAEVSWKDPDISENAWYTPYLAVAFSRSIVSFESVNDSGESLLARPLNRATIAEYLYRTALSEDTVQRNVHDIYNICAGSEGELEGAVLVGKDIAYEGGYIGIRQTLNGVRKDGSKCLLTTNINPYIWGSPHFSHLMLFPLVPRAFIREENTMKFDLGNSGKIWFVAGHETAGYSAELWELDFRTYILRQLPRAERLTIAIANDYSRIAYITADGKSVIIINTLKDNERSQVYTVSDPLTLAAGITEFGGSRLYARGEDLLFDPQNSSLLHVRVYDKRFTSEYGEFDSQYAAQETIDLSKFTR